MNDTNNKPSKKPWVKPEIILISAGTVQGVKRYAFAHENTVQSYLTFSNRYWQNAGGQLVGVKSINGNQYTPQNSFVS